MCGQVGPADELEDRQKGAGPNNLLKKKRSREGGPPVLKRPSNLKTKAVIPEEDCTPTLLTWYRIGDFGRFNIRRIHVSVSTRSSVGKPEARSLRTGTHQ